MTPIQKSILTLAVLVAIGGGAYYLTRTHSSNSLGSSISSSTGSVATSSNGLPPGVTLVTPDYHKPITYSSDTSADVRTQLNKELATVQSDLDANPLSVKDWVDLGTLHKMGGDYANAAIYWEYVATAYKGSIVPYYSLGDLYENFLRDYTKAETDYKLAIQNDSHNVAAYASLFTMYHYTLKDDTKAAAILQQGLSANPGNSYLLGLQQQLSAQ